jgi:hypothetical protein
LNTANFISQFPLLLTRSQAAAMTGLSYQFFDQLRKANVLRIYTSPGGRHRYYRDELVEHFKLLPKPPTKP